jgi:methylase of polypeptide subunit release factors
MTIGVVLSVLVGVAVVGVVVDSSSLPLLFSTSGRRRRNIDKKSSPSCSLLIRLNITSINNKQTSTERRSIQFHDDTSAASCIKSLGSYAAKRKLINVIRRPSNYDVDWEKDVIVKLRHVLDRSNYRHSILHKHIFNLSPQMLIMGPAYVRPLVAGQKLDMSKMMMIDNEEEYDNDDDRLTGSHSDFDCRWLHSLQCLAALFLLASCVPKHIFIQCIVGGDETLQLMTQLGIVFVTSNVVNDELDEWVVPLVHIFPLEIPPVAMFPISSSSSAKHGMTTTETTVDNINYKGKTILIMTDLHPSVLDMTSFDPLESVDKKEKKKEFRGGEGAVMYIGPDSLALIQHLHASLPNCILRNNQSSMTQQPPPSFGRILDVCTGSGVQALATIAMLESIEIDDVSIDPTSVVVDVNERALRFATFNAQLNGYGDKIVTVHADMLSGRILNNETPCESLIDAALYGMKTLGRRKYQIEVDDKFDIILANPPFIPVPPARSDRQASTLRGVEYIDDDVDQSTPRYGLFSSGGTSGEDCLRAIVRMAPSLLKSDGGLLAVVSEFMNPPTPLSLLNITQSTNGKNREHDLITKINSWWGRSHAFGHGILFTNEFAINSEVYAERRALSNDPKDVAVWKNHLSMNGIHSVSPGLLFIRTKDGGQHETHLVLKHHFVIKTDNGSIWTPTNFDAVNFTRQILSL